MKTRTKLLVAAAGLTIGMAALAGIPWKNPKVVEELGLTPQQQQQLEDLSARQERERLDLKYQLDQKRLALKQEMAKDTPNEAAVNRAIDEMSAAQAKMHKMRFAHMQAVRGVLTPEQWTKMKAHRAERQAQRGERGRGMRSGRGMGPGPQAGPGPGPGPGPGFGPDEDDDFGFGPPPEEGGPEGEDLP